MDISAPGKKEIRHRPSQRVAAKSSPAARAAPRPVLKVIGSVAAVPSKAAIRGGHGVRDSHSTYGCCRNLSPKGIAAIVISTGGVIDTVQTVLPRGAIYGNRVCPPCRDHQQKNRAKRQDRARHVRARKITRQAR
jgi:hypothetical protein